MLLNYIAIMYALILKNGSEDSLYKFIFFLPLATKTIFIFFEAFHLALYFTLKTEIIHVDYVISRRFVMTVFDT